MIFTHMSGLLIIATKTTVSSVKISDWFYLVSIITTVISLYISNYLGRKTSENTFRRDALEKRYNSFYVPVMRKMYTFNPTILRKGGMAGNMAFSSFREDPVSEEFQDIAGKTETVPFNWVEQAIKDDIQAVSPELLEIYYESFPLRDKDPLYDHSVPAMSSERRALMKDFQIQKFAYNRKLLSQLLKEASTISEELKLQDISKPLFEALNESYSDATAEEMPDQLDN